MDKKKVLHVVPDSVVVQKKFYLGSTKDVRGRTEYFQTRAILFDEIAVKDRSDDWLLETLKARNLDGYRAIIFELALYPKSMKYVKERFPDLKQITRSINADFYHWLHYFLASYKTSPIRSPLKKLVKSSQYLRLALHRLRLDHVCAGLSDFVFSITDWEKEKYWRLLVSKEKIRTLPYFLPQSYEVIPATFKKDQCVCLMSTTAGIVPLLKDAVMNFNRLVEKLDLDYPEWKFYVTGDVSRMDIVYPPRIKTTGFLESPFPLLSESRSMALLSNFGFGFKTKLLDAIQTGCYALVPPKLYNRLPEEIKPFCIVVNLGSVESFKNALEDCRLEFPNGNPNARLKERAFSVLDELLLD